MSGLNTCKFEEVAIKTESAIHGPTIFFPFLSLWDLNLP